MPIRLMVILLCGALLPATLVADGPEIRWNGEVRIRGEADGRDFNTDSPPMAYTLFRTRVGALVLPASNIRIVIQLQDARYFGQEGTDKSATVANTRNLDLWQGYIEVADFLFSGFSSRIGRMSLSYGNERMVGLGNWGNTGRAFDALAMRYNWSDGSIETFISNVVETQHPVASATPSAVKQGRDQGLMFSGLVYEGKWDRRANAEIFVFHDFDIQQTLPGYVDLSRISMGSRVHGNAGELMYEAEGIYQTGKISRTDIDAFLVGGIFGYFLGEHTLRAGITYLSGTPDGGTKYQVFDAPYPTGHRFYGFMDYFVNIPQSTGLRGLQNVFLQGVFQITPAIAVNATLHHFELTRSEQGLKRLGQELDIVAVAQYGEQLSFEGGLAGFLPDKLMRNSFGGGDVAWWGYVMTRAWF